MEVADSKFLLKSVSKAVCQAVAEQGSVLKTSHAHQLLAASLGFYSSQLMWAAGTPLTLTGGHKRARADQPGLPHLKFLTERAERLLGLDVWKAQPLAWKIQEISRQHGLSVDVHRVLFKDDPAADHRVILKALDDPDFPPASAAAAIARKLIPAPVRTSLRERFLDFAPWLVRASVYARQSGNTLYFLHEPPSSIDEAGASKLDEIRLIQNKVTGASLGLNIAAVMPFRLSRDKHLHRYEVISASMGYGPQEPDLGWKVTRPMSRVYVEDAILNSPPLATHLGREVETLPELHLCRRCLAVYNDDIPALAHDCLPVVDPIALSTVIRHARASGVHSMKTEQMMAALPASDQPVLVQDLDAFLDRYRNVYGLRRLDDVWILGGSNDTLPDLAK